MEVALPPPSDSSHPITNDYKINNKNGNNDDNACTNDTSAADDSSHGQLHVLPSPNNEFYIGCFTCVPYKPSKSTSEI